MTSLAQADRKALRDIAYRPATDNQIRYARVLINSRQTRRLNPDVWRPLVMDLLDASKTWEDFEFSDVSELIDTLKKLPVNDLETVQAAGHQRLARLPYPDVAAGRYALKDLDGYKNEIAFFKVDRPTEGRWAGRTFVKQYRSDEELPVRGEGARKVLALIAEDPKAAMILFGKETSKCGHCGRRLTDDESRDRGIGPVCASKMGW